MCIAAGGANKEHVNSATCEEAYCGDETTSLSLFWALTSLGGRTHKFLSHRSQQKVSVYGRSPQTLCFKTNKADCVCNIKKRGFRLVGNGVETISHEGELDY